MGAQRAAVIIVAAGSSRRMGFDKLTAKLAGESVVVRTVRAFEACELVSDIVVVGGEAVAEAVIAAGFSKLRRVVPGGTERHFSVAEGLDALPEEVEWIGVHDGARPMIEVEQITRCFQAVIECGAVVCARRATDTLKLCDEGGTIVGSLNRDEVWLMETPQVFASALLRQAYSHVLAEGKLVTDEVSAVQAIGAPVKVVENTGPNLKITHPKDIELAESFLSIKEHWNLRV